MQCGKLIVISGPTASGKSNLAFRLAQTWNCPIVSADSRQIYKSVDIGTGKPDPFMLETVTHYFIGTVPVDAQYSVGDYERDALSLLVALFKKHSRIILCGGTGLYLKAILYGMDALPESSESARNLVQQRLESEGPESLKQWLKEVDPKYHDQVDLQNIRRLTRALEVFVMTGKSFSSFRTESAITRPFEIQEICLIPERKVLYQNIDERVIHMLDSGWVEEAKQLIAFRSCQALKSVGYPELYQYLDQKLAYDEAVRLIQQKTRNYAKRQITWFRKTSTAFFYDPQKLDLESLISSM